MANATQYRGLKSHFAGTPKGLRLWLQKQLPTLKAALTAPKQEAVKVKAVSK